MELSRLPPFPIENGHHIHLITKRGTGAVKVFLKKQLEIIKARAHILLPVLQGIRETVDPLLKELLLENEIGGREWCDQFLSGFPMLG